MTALREWISRLLGTLRGHRRDHDLEDELRLHLDLAAQDERRRTDSPARAARAAAIEQGGMAQAMEALRDQRGLPWLDDMKRDVSYAVRGLARNPGFTTVAVLTLALGIGASTAIVSVVYGILLRPLPFPDSHALAMVLNAPFGSASSGDFLDWQTQNRAFEDMAAFTGQTLTLTGQGEPELLMAASVTVRFFDTLHVRAAIGQTLVAQNNQAGQSDVVVLSDRLWRRRFASDPAVVGHVVTLDGRPFTVVGVMPEGFSFPEEVFGPPGRFRSVQTIDLWTPFLPQVGDRGSLLLKVFARLRPTVSLTQAQSDMTSVAQALDAQFSRTRASEIAVVPLHEYVVGEARRLLLLFLGAVGFVLLIACVNVANLLVARATARQKEVAVRSALGAGRARLVRQFLTESALLGILGGAAGVFLAVWGLQAFVGLIPRGSLPRLGEIGVDPFVLLFMLTVSLVAGLTFGLAPVVHTARTDVNTTIKDAGSAHLAGHGLLNVLVVVETAFAVVLLAGAGLLVKSFVRLTGVDPGFERANVMTASVTLPTSAYATSAQMNAFHGQALEQLSNVPGVTAAGAINWVPFGGNLITGDMIVEAGSSASDFNVAKPAVSADYFRVMGIPLVRGRVFTNADTDLKGPVVIVTEDVARRLWPDREPIGQRLKLGFGRPVDQPWASVVGVVKTVKQTGLGDDDMPAIYMPLGQAPRPFLLSQMTFVVRSELLAANMAPAIRAAFRMVDPNLPIHRMERLDSLIAQSVVEPQFRSLLLSVFAAVALALVATGILGVLTYSVTRRTKEIGIRIALGARPEAVARLVVSQAFTLVAVGLILGLGGAFALTRLMRTLLFNVEPTDPGVFALVVVFLLGVALVASYLPARRAARVDPLVALRYE